MKRSSGTQPCPGLFTQNRITQILTALLTDGHCEKASYARKQSHQKEKTT